MITYYYYSLKFYYNSSSFIDDKDVSKIDFELINWLIELADIYNCLIDLRLVIYFKYILKNSFRNSGN